MADRAYVRYPDQATDALLARADAALHRSARAVITVDKAWRRVADAIRLCDALLGRLPRDAAAAVRVGCQPPRCSPRAERDHVRRRLGQPVRSTAR